MNFLLQQRKPSALQALRDPQAGAVGLLKIGFCFRSGLYGGGEKRTRGRFVRGGVTFY